MAISMKSLKRVKADQPPRLLIYGPEGMGKTTLASEFPGAVFLQTERGEAAGLELDTLSEDGEQQLNSYEQVYEALQALCAEDHDFQTVVIDSVSALEKLIWRRVCQDGGVDNIEQYEKGYGKGYVAADNYWNQIIEGLNFLRTQRGMAVVLIGHSIISKFEDPETETYSVYRIDLQKRAEALIKREVDAVLLVKKDVTIKRDDAKKPDSRARADGGDQRWIYTEGRPAFTAKNRYGMPARILFNKGAGFAALSPFFPSAAPAADQPAAEAA